MSILPAQTIRKLGIFTPFSERTKFAGMTYGLGPAGYDVRINESVTVPPGGACLASTMEHFKMPNDVLGQVVDKSTWARSFLAVQNTVIEPGWHGHLTIELSNHGTRMLRIEAGTPIAQIVLFRLEEATEQPYEGKYQGQPNRVVEPILEL